MNEHSYPGNSAPAPQPAEPQGPFAAGELATAHNYYSGNDTGRAGDADIGDAQVGQRPDAPGQQTGALPGEQTNRIDREPGGEQRQPADWQQDRSALSRASEHLSFVDWLPAEDIGRRLGPLDKASVSGFQDDIRAAFAMGEGGHQQLFNSAMDRAHRWASDIVAKVHQHQVDTWNRTNENWIGQVKADPELGGNRLEASLGNAKYAIQSMMGLRGNEAAELLQVLDLTGAGNHPAVVRAFHRLFETYREPGPVNPNPPGAHGGAQGGRGWYDTLDNPRRVP
ncbi:MAG TPA: hypothetical protein VH684_11560 [Xanthobacteraceae bacterium]|jgi:hypothetical protein